MPGITIQEAAEKTGLTVHTLRYYEQIELIPPVERESNGHRRYQDTDLDWIDYVLCLKAVGMPLEDIRRYVQLQTERADETLPERVRLLESHRDAIRRQIDALQANLDHIEYKIERYSQRLP